jgi:hypothetical protein
MFNHRIINHLNIYYLGLILIAVSLPLSKFALSVSIFILLGNWILEGEFRRKINILKNRGSVLIISSIVFIHIIWLFNTSDIQSGLHDIQIKAPLLALPLIIGTSRGLDKKQIGIILLFFIAAVTVASLIIAFIFFGFTGVVVDNIKDASVFISHIRFSLMVNVAIFFLALFVFDNYYFKPSGIAKIIFIITLFWLIIFLGLFQTLTGIVIFTIIGYFMVVRSVILIKNRIIRYLLFVLLIGIVPASLVLIHGEVVKYYDVEEVIPGSLALYTSNNNIYHHDPGRKEIENGKYVWIYVCEDEIREEWNKRSELNYSGYDLKGQEIKYTLVRFLTSKGLRKDSAAIWKLSDSDVHNIEKGIANYIYSDKFSAKALIYRIIWEFDRYRKGLNPSGHSLTQRIVYWKTGLELIKQNFWFGVGTGDLQMVFDKQYEDDNSVLEPDWRLRAHNQFLSFFIAFGVFGFLYCTFALFAPVVLEKKYHDLFFMIFFIIGVLSFLNEDTLETHVGATFFAFFYALLLFGLKDVSRQSTVHKKANSD